MDWARFLMVKKKISASHGSPACFLAPPQSLAGVQPETPDPPGRPCGGSRVQAAPSLSPQRRLQAEAPAAGPAGTRLPGSPEQGVESSTWP